MERLNRKSNKHKENNESNKKHGLLNLGNIKSKLRYEKVFNYI